MQTSSISPNIARSIAAIVGFEESEFLLNCYSYSPLTGRNEVTRQDILVGVTLRRVFGYSKGTVKHTLLTDIQKVSHERNLFFCDNIILTTHSGRVEKYGVSHREICADLCTFLQANLPQPTKSLSPAPPGGPQEDMTSSCRRETKEGISSIIECNLFVFLCDGDNYLIGLTAETVEECFKEHCTGKVCEWTQRHRPLRIIAQGKGSKHMVESLVLDYMETFGISKVRGWPYLAYQLSDEQEKEIQRRLLASDALLKTPSASS